MILGVTIDRIDELDKTIAALEALPSSHPGWPPTARLVCDPGVPAKDYLEVCKRLETVATILLCPVDSYAMAPSEDWEGYTVKTYRERFEEYLSVLGRHVSYVECLNEGGGDWLGTEVVTKANAALEVVTKANAALKIKTVITYYLDGSFPTHLIHWAAKAKLKADLHMVSYYPRSAPKEADLDFTFAQLAKEVTGDLAIGETGSEDASGDQGTNEIKTELIKRMYSFSPSLPAVESRYVGGGFWWDFCLDAARGPLLPVFEGL